MAENEPAGPLQTYRNFVEGLARDYPEQHRQAQENIQQNLEQGRAANSALLEFLNSQRGTGPSPMLQLASGLLRPTRAGSFAESLGTGAESYAGALQQQRQGELDRAMRIQQLQQATANLNMQATQQRMALMNQGLQFPGTIAGAYGSLADLGLLQGDQGQSGVPQTRTQLAVPGAAQGPMPSASPVGPQPQITATPLPAPPPAAPAADARVNPEASPQVQSAIARARDIEGRLRADPGNQALSAQFDRALADVEAAWAAAQSAPPAPTASAAVAAPAPAAPPPAPMPAAAPLPAAPMPAAAPAPAAAQSSDPLVAGAQRLLADAAANPSRYAGPQGRQLVDRARTILRESSEQQGEIAAARRQAEEDVDQRNAAQRADRRFSEESATQQARTFGELAAGGAEARQLMDRLQMFDQVSADLRSGIPGWFEQQAARVGFGPRATYIETANALLKQLIPAQRQGMPGAVSDFDARNFEQSLPRLIGTPEGRAMISNTLKSVAEYNIARAQIASAAANGQISRQAAVERLNELPSPFVRFNRMEAERAEQQRQQGGSRGAPQSNIPPPPPGIDPREWGAMRPEDRALWQN
jgi:hypothetical protein